MNLKLIKNDFTFRSWEWTAIDKYAETITHGIGVEGITFVQMKGNASLLKFLKLLVQLD